MRQKILAFPEAVRLSDQFKKERDDTSIPKKLKIISGVDEISPSETSRYLLKTQQCEVPILYYGRENANNVIISFTSGNRAKEKEGQFFTRWKYNKYYNAIYICIDSPMCRFFPSLQKSTPSWYLGTKEFDLCLFLSEVIKSLAKKLGISLENFCLLGSSAGGYAACSIGAHINGCNVIAISPQLVVSNWHEYPAFESETGFVIKDSERDNIIPRIHGSVRTNFYLTYNFPSKKDYLTQLKPFLASFGSELELPYGLSRLNNHICIWAHNTKGKSLHSSGIGKFEISYLLNFAFNTCLSRDSEEEFFEISKILTDIMEEKAAIERKDKVLEEKSEEELKFLYSKKQFSALTEVLPKFSADKLYYAGMAFYRLKNYDNAIQIFRILEVVDTNRTFYNDSLIGFSYFRRNDFEHACQYFIKDFNADPSNLKCAAHYLGSLLIDRKCLSAEFLDSFDKFTENEKRVIFGEIINFAGNNIFKINSKALNSDIVNLQYSLTLREHADDSNDDLYILTHPLITGRSLFGNRDFQCDVLFVEQRFQYFYFMLDTDVLLDTIANKIKNKRYKNITILSSSAGAYFSLLLGTYLSKVFSHINVQVHAFSPQTLINDNRSLSSIPHYASLEKFKSTLSIKENLNKYGDLRQVLSSSENVKYNLYYGTDSIDASEAQRLINLKLPNLKGYLFEGFPYHQSFFIYRYSLDRFLDKKSELKPNAGSLPVEEPSVDELRDIHNKYAPTNGLKRLLPFLV